MNPTHTHTAAPVKPAPLIGVPLDKPLHYASTLHPVPGGPNEAAYPRFVHMLPGDSSVAIPLVGNTIPGEQLQNGVTIAGLELNLYARCQQPLQAIEQMKAINFDTDPDGTTNITHRQMGAAVQNNTKSFPVEIKIVRMWTPLHAGAPNRVAPGGVVQNELATSIFDGADTLGHMATANLTGDYSQEQLLDAYGAQQTQTLYTGIIDMDSSFLRFAVPLCSVRLKQNDAGTIRDFMAKNPDAALVHTRDTPEVKTNTTEGTYTMVAILSPVIGGKGYGQDMQFPDGIRGDLAAMTAYREAAMQAWVTVLQYQLQCNYIYYDGFAQSAVHTTELTKTGAWKINDGTVAAEKESVWGGTYWPVSYEQRITSSFGLWQYPQAQRLLRSGAAWTPTGLYDDFQSILREPGLYGGKLNPMPGAALIPTAAQAKRLLKAAKRGHPKKKKAPTHALSIKAVTRGLNL